MMITFRNRCSLTVFAVAACGAGVASFATACTASRPTSAVIGQAATAGYWTRYRMEHAITLGPKPPSPRVSADGLAWTHGGAVARYTGKVFFTLGGTDYVCSGAALADPRSRGTGVVVTAAHCVTDGYGTRAANWIFVPGYSDGNDPYGSYSARRYFVSRRWNAGLNEAYDVAFVSVRGLSPGLPVAFGAAPHSVYVFGYPEDPPFDGDHLRFCSGPRQRDPADPGADSGVRCAMTEGDSGGPWLANFDPATGTGTVVAVSAFKYSGDAQILYGAALDRTARQLYESAERGLVGQHVDLAREAEVRGGQPARGVGREL